MKLSTYMQGAEKVPDRILLKNETDYLFTKFKDINCLLKFKVIYTFMLQDYFSLIVMIFCKYESTSCYRPVALRGKD